MHKLRVQARHKMPRTRHRQPRGFTHAPGASLRPPFCGVWSSYVTDWTPVSNCNYQSSAVVGGCVPFIPSNPVHPRSSQVIPRHPRSSQVIPGHPRQVIPGGPGERTYASVRASVRASVCALSHSTGFTRIPKRPELLVACGLVPAAAAMAHAVAPVGSCGCGLPCSGAVQAAQDGGGWAGTYSPFSAGDSSFSHIS